jgi:hypothetical protein
MPARRSLPSVVWIGLSLIPKGNPRRFSLKCVTSLKKTFWTSLRKLRPIPLFIRTEPYEAERLDAPLDDQGRRFLAQQEKDRWADGILYLSPIFDWFKEDFGNVPTYVAPFFPEGPCEKITAGNLKISYTPYDWTLNDVRKGETHPC